MTNDATETTFLRLMVSVHTEQLRKCTNARTRGALKKKLAAAETKLGIIADTDDEAHRAFMNTLDHLVG